jgi:hypothetical protein
MCKEFRVVLLNKTVSFNLEVQLSCCSQEQTRHAAPLLVSYSGGRLPGLSLD